MIVSGTGSLTPGYPGLKGRKTVVAMMMMMQLFVVVADWCHQGAELDVALTVEDYQVTVDDLPCPVVLLTRSMLSCRVDALTTRHITVDHAAVKVAYSAVIAASFEHL